MLNPRSSLLTAFPLILALFCASCVDADNHPPPRAERVEGTGRLIIFEDSKRGVTCYVGSTWSGLTCVKTGPDTVFVRVLEQAVERTPSGNP
jgi:hypothetical protein